MNKNLVFENAEILVKNIDKGFLYIKKDSTKLIKSVLNIVDNNFKGDYIEAFRYVVNTYSNAEEDMRECVMRHLKLAGGEFKLALKKLIRAKVKEFK